MTQVLEPRICVVCCAACKEGKKHAFWINVSGDQDLLSENIRTILKKSPVPHAEKWMIYDYDGFGSVNMQKYNDIDSICRIAEIILYHGESGEKLINHYEDIARVEAQLTNHYKGEWRGEMAFVMDYVQRSCRGLAIPDLVKEPVDFEKIRKSFFAEDYRSIKIGDVFHILSQGA